MDLSEKEEPTWSGSDRDGKVPKKNKTDGKESPPPPLPINTGMLWRNHKGRAYWRLLLYFQVQIKIHVKQYTKKVEN